MVSKERLLFINENLYHGDKKKVSENTSLDYGTVDNILRGRSYGDSGTTVVEEAERIVTERIERLSKEKAQYQKRLKIK